MIPVSFLQERFNGIGQEETFTAVFGHFFQGDACFLRDDCGDTRKTETSLAASHARAGTALDAVDRPGADRTADGPADFRLGDYLAAADDITV
jgi:hypothetical protein